jgi:hypothetical protein
MLSRQRSPVRRRRDGMKRSPATEQPAHTPSERDVDIAAENGMRNRDSVAVAVAALCEERGQEKEKEKREGRTCGELAVLQEELQDAAVGEIERGVFLMQLLHSVDPIPGTEQLNHLFRRAEQSRAEQSRGGEGEGDLHGGLACGGGWINRIQLIVECLREVRGEGRGWR